MKHLLILLTLLSVPASAVSASAQTFCQKRDKGLLVALFCVKRQQGFSPAQKEVLFADDDDDDKKKKKRNSSNNDSSDGGSSSGGGNSGGGNRG